ncbi:zinc finger protein 135-like [Nerophis ophidion]|uniref:zinc finger protein 135-like n=1 Tax=Nerophis ophidion TaxID=159077 RepID=UPI002ADF3A09|nr:zinc finger protein 135-like [Nerophis ophidion]
MSSEVKIEDVIEDGRLLYAKMVTSCQRESERTSSKSPTEMKIKIKDEDVQQLISHPEELPLQSQLVSFILKEEDPQPPRIKEEEDETQPPHFKEEAEKLWITREGDCLLGREEADPTKLPPTVVSVKTEVDEEKPQSGHLEELPSQPQGECSVLRPWPRHIKKEEPEKLWITQEGEWLPGPQEAGLTKLPRTLVSVKTEDDEEKPQPGDLLAPLSDSETEDEVGVSLRGDTDCEGDMRTHTDHIHSECSKKIRGEISFSCSVCAKSFSKKGNLSVHLRTHTGEKPFNCSVCAKSFSQKNHLSEHMTTHTGEKTFNCSICGKTFSLKSNLTKHMKTHTGEKPFNCTECGKNFTKKGNLTEHAKIHKGEKPFKCSDCGKGFLQKANLTEHMKIHTGEKPFNCSVCDKRFCKKSTLIKHKRKHTG